MTTREVEGNVWRKRNPPMDKAKKEQCEWRAYLSPLRITLLSINAVCFGGSYY